MATILKRDKRDFKEDPNKIDNFRLFSDFSRVKMGIRPQNLNFDLRLLNPGQFSAPYHFHRHAEELFMVVSGTMTLRTPERLEIVNRGDIIFFEMCVTGAHQFYNHGSEPCIILMFEPSSAMMCANTLIPGNCCWLLRMRYSTKDPN